MNNSVLLHERDVPNYGIILNDPVTFLIKDSVDIDEESLPLLLQNEE